MALKCPTCGFPTLVNDSRTTPTRVRRRRQCTGCNARWTSYELILPRGDAEFFERMNQGDMLLGGYLVSAVNAWARDAGVQMTRRDNSGGGDDD